MDVLENEVLEDNEETMLQVMGEMFKERFSRLQNAQHDNQRIVIPSPQTTVNTDMKPVADAFERFATELIEKARAEVTVTNDMAPVAASIDRVSRYSLEQNERVTEAIKEIYKRPAVHVDGTDMSAVASGLELIAEQMEGNNKLLKELVGGIVDLAKAIGKSSAKSHRVVKLKKGDDGTWKGEVEEK